MAALPDDPTPSTVAPPNVLESPVAPPPVSAPAVSPPGPPAPPPASTGSSPRRWRLVIGIAAVVVAVIVVVAVLALSGALSGGGAPTATDYNTAIAASNAAMGRYPGGPWTPVWAVGIAVPQPVSLSGATFQAGLFVCSEVSTINAPSTVTITSTSNSASSGTVSYWLMYYEAEASGTSVLVEDAGNSTVLMYSGTGCSELVDFGNISGAVVNSPAAVNTTDANGGSNFSATHDVKTKIFELIAPGGFFDEWAIAYSTCALSASGSGIAGEGTEFIASVSATNGTFLGSSTLEC